MKLCNKISIDQIWNKEKEEKESRFSDPIML
jgi:hypothetical protein